MCVVGKQMDNLSFNEAVFLVISLPGVSDNHLRKFLSMDKKTKRYDYPQKRRLICTELLLTSACNDTCPKS